MSRTDPNDPYRCEATTQTGQCAHQAIDGQNLCAYHLKDRDVEDKMSLRSYHLTDAVLAESAGRHSQVEEVKSLREEITICRSLVERCLNTVESNADLLAVVGRVNSLFLTLEKLISSCHRLETSLGTLLSRASLLELAKGIVGIIMDELEGIDNYEEVVDKISERILGQIANFDVNEK